MKTHMPLALVVLGLACLAGLGLAMSTGKLDLFADAVAYRASAKPAGASRAVVAVVPCRHVFQVSAVRQRFTLPHSVVAGSELVFRNGLLMAPKIDYRLEGSGGELVFVSAQRISAGDILQILH